MDGIEKLTARIQEDADAELAKLKAKTESEIETLQIQTEHKINEDRAQRLVRGEKAAQEHRERLKSAADLERRKLMLAAKQEIVQEAFDQAVEELANLPEEEYVALLTGLVLQGVVTGKESVIFSPKDRSRIGKQVVMAANDALVKEVAPDLPASLGGSKVGAFLGKVVNNAAAQIMQTGLLTLSEETRPIRGGVILVDGPVETNCSFEMLLRMQREKLEKEVAKILFP